MSFKHVSVHVCVCVRTCVHYLYIKLFSSLDKRFSGVSDLLVGTPFLRECLNSVRSSQQLLSELRDLECKHLQPQITCGYTNRMSAMTK